MNIIPQYILVTDHNHRMFVNLVNEYLQKGWKLQGGVAVMAGKYAQAMTMDHYSGTQVLTEEQNGNT